MMHKDDKPGKNAGAHLNRKRKTRKIHFFNRRDYRVFAEVNGIKG